MDGIAFELAERAAILVEIPHRLAVQRNERVARHEAGLGRLSAFDRPAYDERDTGFGKVGAVEQLGHRLGGNSDTLLFPVSLDGHVFRLVENDRREQLGRVVERFAVYVHDPVAVAEPDPLGQLAVGVAVLDIPVIEIGLAPRPAHADVYQQGEHDIHHDASDHNQQPLPGRLGPELVGLYGLLHLVGVHRFVDHARYFDVSAERNPADAVLGLSLAELEQREPRVEEQVELFDPRLENPGEQEMSELVDDDQQGKAENELEKFDQDIHRCFVFSFVRSARAPSRVPQRPFRGTVRASSTVLEAFSRASAR